MLRFLDPTTFEVTRSLEVRDGGAPISSLNELEFVKGEGPLIHNPLRTRADIDALVVRPPEETLPLPTERI